MGKKLLIFNIALCALSNFSRVVFAGPPHTFMQYVIMGWHSAKYTILLRGSEFFTSVFLFVCETLVHHQNYDS